MKLQLYVTYILITEGKLHVSLYIKAALRHKICLSVIIRFKFLKYMIYKKQNSVVYSSPYCRY